MSSMNLRHLCHLYAFVSQCPPGMKQQVLIFFTNLLGKLRQQLLPHVNAHRPVHVSFLVFIKSVVVLVPDDFPCELLYFKDLPLKTSVWRTVKSEV